MVRIPGLDLVSPYTGHPFGGFCSIPPKLNEIGSIRSSEKFALDFEKKPRPAISLTQGHDSENSKNVSLVVYGEIQDPDDELTDILLEVDIIKSLNHENVLKFYEIISGPKVTDVALVFEPFGIVMTRIMEEKIGKLYNPPVVKTIMRDLFTALAYLHKNGIIHRDIQPDNILFSSSGVLKLWNFRNAIIFGPKPRKLKVSDLRYQSPELLLETMVYNESVDIWSANCIFAHLLLERPIFPRNGKENVLHSIFKLLGFPMKEVWEEFFDYPYIQDFMIFSGYKYNNLDKYFHKFCDREISPLAVNLLHKCFRYNPEIRLGAELCLQHPYFSEDPKACPIEEIAKLKEEANIYRKIRIVKEKKH
ncbi:cyclin-dependent kinase 5 homolog isoform X2 [Argiope bruennichi]|uniref:cyclin-dependent kinase 5 homolog isoform X2 n=1 Tax=Argiope bruennichi TaxID=94029 RepID=UPI002494EB12|nr:cyclin-dependent kinase 5 homolog isoform X2 [Argiope bruennichi]